MGKRPVNQSWHRAQWKMHMEALLHCRVQLMQLWPQGPVVMLRGFPLKRSLPATQLQHSACKEMSGELPLMSSSLKVALSSRRWR